MEAKEKEKLVASLQAKTKEELIDEIVRINDDLNLSKMIYNSIQNENKKQSATINAIASIILMFNS